MLTGDAREALKCALAIDAKLGLKPYEFGYTPQVLTSAFAVLGLVFANRFEPGNTIQVDAPALEVPSCQYERT